MRKYAICNSLIGETLYAHDIKALKALIEFCNKNQPYDPSYFPSVSVIHYVPAHDTYYIGIYYDVDIKKFREELKQVVKQAVDV